ncbi:hypothetical protein L21SP5_03906 [Salinivirga cyanobacteriivorans]|uniref:4-O-methyl-glucuronoyl methylesterase-like domain-containing protein n=1 Tax=Salinivirga cyanobacteriivorans TaxID=1307839 RepID=A0A0S2I4W0_9BACT|nr:acetylxylan esterase [Salinivirga cyanobacteriivorans]ALO17497.1 hypothetical protein L21SP5_03906 [Salinivirga cyanobacteriivorans]
MVYKIFFALVLLSISVSCSFNADKDQNCDEDAVEPYELPDVLTLKNGEKIDRVSVWENKRRPQILNLYKKEIYGFIPKGIDKPLISKVLEQSDSALDNTAIRKQISLIYKAKGKELEIIVLLYLPKNTKNPPVFIGYNFYGNQTIIDDKHVILTNSWILNNPALGINDNRASEESMGTRNERWPIKKIISEGFGLATVYYGDIDPERCDFSDGIHPFFYKKKQNKPKGDQWGSISAWAWGYSRILDYLKKDEMTRKSKFILFGHSRIGKTSLWAGALDRRFDIVISNNSGCAGAALFRRKFGETIAKIHYNFPQWFCQNFNKYRNKEERLPVDQHMLIALIAPRPVYIASAELDCFSDPKGEYLSAYHATPVYELYGKTGLNDSIQPPLNKPIHNTIGYHLRSGRHGVTTYDWEQFIKFVKKHLE